MYTATTIALDVYHKSEPIATQISTNAQCWCLLRFSCYCSDTRLSITVGTRSHSVGTYVGFMSKSYWPSRFRYLKLRNKDEEDKQNIVYSLVWILIN